MTKLLHALPCFWGHFPVGQRAPISISMSNSRPLGLPYQRAEPTAILSWALSAPQLRIWVPSHPGCILLLLGLTQFSSSGVVQACES